MISARFAATPVILAILLSGISGLAGAQALIDLDQHWSPEEQKQWHLATQGSRLIPQSWLRALEQPGGTGRFLAEDHIAKFRYLAGEDGTGLPLGFVIDNGNDEAFSKTPFRWKTRQSAREPWVGMNCAACHTADIHYKGSKMRVEGGPGMADFQGFMEALNRALVETRDNPEKFRRFARDVLDGEDNSVNRQSLRAELGRFATWQLKVERANATGLRYGFGRLDAIGHIFNKVALLVEATKPRTSPADAPVSYPFLWNVPQLNAVQYNAMVPNQPLPKMSFSQPFDLGALGRNVGEVIGVFGEIEPTAVRAGLRGYKSSVRIGNLVSMEQMLGSLWPPAWPSTFPAPDPALVPRGKELYLENCQGCHAVLDRTDLVTGPIKVKQRLFRETGAEDQTDLWMACNAYLRDSPTGLLKGTPRRYLTGKDQPLESTERLRDILAVTVLGTIAGGKEEAIKSAALSFIGKQPPPAVDVSHLPPLVGSGRAILSPKEQERRTCLSETDANLGYKARPLTGIWATAPYLHNGSVPTLRDLLRAPEDRPKSFWLGSREFDPDNVGFVTGPSAENSFEFKTKDAGGRYIEGNSSAGHSYGTQLPDPDKDALLAYLKTL